MPCIASIRPGCFSQLASLHGSDALRSPGPTSSGLVLPLASPRHPQESEREISNSTLSTARSSLLLPSCISQPGGCSGSNLPQARNLAGPGTSHPEFDDPGHPSTSLSDIPCNSSRVIRRTLGTPLSVTVRKCGLVTSPGSAGERGRIEELACELGRQQLQQIVDDMLSRMHPDPDAQCVVCRTNSTIFGKFSVRCRSSRGPGVLDGFECQIEQYREAYDWLPAFPGSGVSPDDKFFPRPPGVRGVPIPILMRVYFGCATAKCSVTGFSYANYCHECPPPPQIWYSR